MFHVLLATALSLAPLTDPPKTLDSVSLGATFAAQARRVSPPAPVGLHGLPFAPEGIDDCGEARYYRVQWGLPERFDGIVWRESNCRQEDGVRTFCCYGYLQLYVSLHLKDHRLNQRYHDCGVFSKDDVNSDDPLEKQRHMCAAKAVFDVQGINAWVATK